ncbi:MAG: hypothetical protein AAGC74_00230 [Verrucomicrobiota bacterium]
MNDAMDSLSDLERNVLFALAEDDPERETLLRQIESARVADRDYTGVGLYTKLTVNPDVPKLTTTNRLIEDYPKLGLIHPDLEAGAGVILWLDEAKIDTIEFYTFSGDWPKDEAAFKIDKPNKTLDTKT